MLGVGTEQTAAALRNLADMKRRKTDPEANRQLARRGDTDALLVADMTANVAAQSQAAEKQATMQAAKGPQPKWTIEQTPEGQIMKYEGPVTDPVQDIQAARAQPAEAWIKKLESDAVRFAEEQIGDPYGADIDEMLQTPEGRQRLIEQEGLMPKGGAVVGPGEYFQRRRKRAFYEQNPDELRKAAAANRFSRQLGLFNTVKGVVDERQDMGDRGFRENVEARRLAAEDRRQKSEETDMFLSLIKRNPLGYGSPEKMIETFENLYQRPLKPWEADVARNEFANAQAEQEASQIREQLAIERDERARFQLQLQLETLQETIRERQENKRQSYVFKLSDDYRQEMKPFIALDDQVSKIEALAQRKTGEADYAIILNFVSSIDNSVARESEVATARGTVGLYQQAQQMLTKWEKGDLLAPEVRQRFVQTAKSLRQSLEPRRQDFQGYYRDRAQDLGVDPRMIGPGLDAQTAPAGFIVQRNEQSGEYRHSFDGGKTWHSGRPNGNR